MAKFTRKAIISSFLGLLNIRELDKITVKDIVEDCDINRKTFYYYFEDIYDLLKQMFIEEMSTFDISKIESGDPEEAVLRLTEYVRRNSRAVMHVYNSVSKEELQQYLYELSYKGFAGFVEKQAEGIEHSPEDISLICKLLSVTFVGLTFDWLKSNMPQNAEEYIAKISKMLDGAVEFMLKNLYGG